MLPSTPHSENKKIRGETIHTGTSMHITKLPPSLVSRLKTDKKEPKKCIAKDVNVDLLYREKGNYATHTRMHQQHTC